MALVEQSLPRLTHEEPKSKVTPKTILAGTMAVLITGGIGSVVYRHFDKGTDIFDHTAQLTDRQDARLQSSLKLGSLGLGSYKDMLHPPKYETYITELSGSREDGRKLTAPLALGDSVEANSFVQALKYTPDATESDAIISVTSHFITRYAEAHEEMKFENPDEEFFGADKAASAAEIVRFFNDPDTRATEDYIEDVDYGNAYFDIGEKKVRYDVSDGQSGYFNTSSVTKLVHDLISHS